MDLYIQPCDIYCNESVCVSSPRFLILFQSTKMKSKLKFFRYCMLFWWIVMMFIHLHFYFIIHYNRSIAKYGIIFLKFTLAKWWSCYIYIKLFILWNNHNIWLFENKKDLTHLIFLKLSNAMKVSKRSIKDILFITRAKQIHPTLSCTHTRAHTHWDTNSIFLSYVNKHNVIVHL